MQRRQCLYSVRAKFMVGIDSSQELTSATADSVPSTFTIAMILSSTERSTWVTVARTT